MPRTPKPWRRGGPEGPWYASVGGRQVMLAPPHATFAEAKRALAEARSSAASPSRIDAGAGLTVGQAAELFLEWVAGEVARGNRASVTLEGYERLLLPFAVAEERTRVADLGEDRVNRWLDSTNWNPTTKRNFITSLKACLNRLAKQGLAPPNPIGGMERPHAARREYVPDEETFQQILMNAPDQQFRDLLELLSQTGCRPGELYGIEGGAIDLEAGTMRVANKTYRRTGERVRLVPLTKLSVERLARLKQQRPEGPLLLNTKGNPWTRNAVALRFRRLREKLGLPGGAVAYSLRHRFVTDALEAGVPIATVAEIVGHKDLTMIQRVYSKLGQRTAHLREAAERVSEARRTPRDPGPSSPGS